ncbi:MAG: carbonic anhydrase family protein [Pseudomonadota bacterium]
MGRIGSLALLGALALSFNTYAAEKAGHDAHDKGKGHDVHWGYTGEASAEHWGDLKQEFALCKVGQSQSPIDIDDAIKADLNPIDFNYKAVPLKVINNGHTIQVGLEGAGTIKLHGDEYKLLQFHFHAPSEHTAQGKSYDMEVHLVHKSDKGKLAVVGVFMKPGKENAALKAVFDNMPKEAGETEVKGASLNPQDLLPKAKDYSHYIGSLTTPPCSEGVRWNVLTDTIEVSQAQIDAFKALYAMNARPVQDQHDRFLLKNGK